MSGNLIVKPISAKLTHDTETFGKMDPFVCLKLGADKYQTKVHQDAGKYPSWNETFSFRKQAGSDILEIEVYDYDSISKNDLIGRSDYYVGNLKATQNESIYIELSYKGKSAGQILVEFTFYPDGPAESSQPAGFQPVGYYPTGVFVPQGGAFMPPTGMYPNFPQQGYYPPQGYPYPNQYPQFPPGGQGQAPAPNTLPQNQTTPVHVDNVPSKSEEEKPAPICGHGMINPHFNPSPEPFQEGPKEYMVETHNNLDGKENMNQPYLRTQLPLHRGRVEEIRIRGESKDQGWASVEGSCSWLEVGIEDANTGQEIGKREKVFENYKFKEYKQFDVTVNNRQILEDLSGPGNQLVLYARSMYPGWLCYVRKAQIIVKCGSGSLLPKKKKIKMDFEASYFLPGEENMNRIYVKSDLPPFPRDVYKVKIEGLTKDQGWADGDSSSSWIEVGIVNDQDSEIIERKRIHENLRVSEFKPFKAVIKDIGFLSKLADGRNQVAVYARSMYPGWICEVQKINIHIHLAEN